MLLTETLARSILTPTGGFLEGFTHSLNPYRGCAYGGSFCGVACYAPEIRVGAPPPAPWGRWLVVKTNAPELYPADHDRARRRGAPLRIFMSSVTDPYVPQERRYRLTGRLLAAMVTRPPDLLVLQTHTPWPLWDADTLAALAARASLAVQISVETDQERIPGFPRHAHSIDARIDALATLRARGITAVGVVAPMMPLADPERFAARLDAACDYVILDHYLLGDGSPGGARTRRPRTHTRAPAPELLARAGHAPWTHLERFREVVALFEARLGRARLGVSGEGFNHCASATLALRRLET
jgi:DNA repair photolyase